MEEIKEKELLREIKKENLEKLYKIVVLAEGYKDNKKVLKQIVKIASLEIKNYKEIKVSVPEKIKNEMIMDLEDLKEILKKIISGKSIERYNKTKEELKSYANSIKAEIEACSQPTVVKEIKNFFDSAKNKVAEIKNAVKEEFTQRK